MCDCTRRTFLTALSATSLAALAGCDLAPKPRIADLPDHGPDEAPYAIPSIDPATIKIPDTPKIPLPSDVGLVVPRTAWTLAGPDLAHMRPMDGVKLITFHHSGDGKPFLADDPHDVARHLEGVRLFHRQRGMVDIAYHFAIDHAGRAWQLRHLKYEGQHVRISASGVHWNLHNIGIVILGDFSKQPVSPGQKERIVAFGTFLLKHYELPHTAIKTHQELVDTDCPGKALQPYMLQIRQQHLL